MQLFRFENVACNFFVSKMLHATFLCVWVCLRFWTFLETGRLGGACGACACVVVREGEDGGGSGGRCSERIGEGRSGPGIRGFKGKGP